MFGIRITTGYLNGLNDRELAFFREMEDSFHPDRYPEDADNCPGYESKAAYERRMQELSKRKTK